MKQKKIIYDLLNNYRELLQYYLVSRKLSTKILDSKLQRISELRVELSSKSNISISGNFSNQLCQIHQDLIQLLDEYGINTVIHRVKIVNKFNFHKLTSISGDYKIINKLNNYVKPIESYLSSAFIHGSYATQDFIPAWSDLDFVIILNSNAFQSNLELAKIRSTLVQLTPLFLWIDPLAHHYFQIMSDVDLRAYPQSYLPLESIKQGLLVAGSGNIDFNVREDTSDVASKLQRLTNSLIKVKIPKNLAQFKDLISYTLLIPSLLLQTKGIYIYKRESFSRARLEFPEIDFSAIDLATKIRKEWPVASNLTWLNILPLKICAPLLHVFSKAAKRKSLSKKMQSQIQQMSPAIDALLDSIRQNVH